MGKSTKSCSRVLIFFVGYCPHRTLRTNSEALGRGVLKAVMGDVDL